MTQPIQLEAGMRVRCVASSPHFGLDVGDEHIIDVAIAGLYESLVKLRTDNPLLSGTWSAKRFKPVVRVKARTCPRGNNPVVPDFAFRARLHRFATSGE